MPKEASDTPPPAARLKAPGDHCCAALRYYVEHEDRIVLWWPSVREYLIPVHDGGTSGIVLRFCPWCGRRLPESTRAEAPGTLPTGTVDPAVELRARVLLSLQRALLGEVPPALRGLLVGWSRTALEFIAYFDGPVAEADEESMSVVRTEVAADFAPELRVDYRCVRRDAPNPLPLPTGWSFPVSGWVYRRRES